MRLNIWPKKMMRLNPLYWRWQLVGSSLFSDVPPSFIYIILHVESVTVMETAPTIIYIYIYTMYSIIDMIMEDF